MLKIIEKPINQEELEKLAEEIGKFFVKVVVDLEKGILCAGAKMHFEEEQELINHGSQQNNLWGGGYDLEEKKITFDSIINHRPKENPSEEILNTQIREKFEKLVKYLFNV